MAIAKYDFEAMRAQAAKLQKGADNLKDLIKQVDNAVAEMKSGWTDPAQTKFEEQWTEMSQKLKEYGPIIEEYSKAVDKHADKIESDGRRV